MTIRDLLAAFGRATVPLARWLLQKAIVWRRVTSRILVPAAWLMVSLAIATSIFGHLPQRVAAVPWVGLPSDSRAWFGALREAPIGALAWCLAALLVALVMTSNLILLFLRLAEHLHILPAPVLDALRKVGRATLDSIVRLVAMATENPRNAAAVGVGAAGATTLGLLVALGSRHLEISAGDRQLRAWAQVEEARVRASTESKLYPSAPPPGPVVDVRVFDRELPGPAEIGVHDAARLAVAEEIERVDRDRRVLREARRARRQCVDEFIAELNLDRREASFRELVRRKLFGDTRDLDGELRERCAPLARGVQQASQTTSGPGAPDPTSVSEGPGVPN